MKSIDIHKPPEMTRAKWIAALCQRYPHNASMIRTEAGDLNNRKRVPFIRRVYEEKRDYVYGEQPPYIEYELAFEDIRWESE